MRVILLLTGLVLASGCAGSSEGRDQARGDGEVDAATACRLVHEAFQSASDRVDAVNNSGEELAHPAQIGGDGFNDSEWQRFTEASSRADRAASQEDVYKPLAKALRRLMDGKGDSGVGATFTLGEPLGEAFDECESHGFPS